MSTPEHLQPLEQQALRLVSSMGPGAGAGEVVWHVWGDAQAGRAPLVLLHGGSGSWTHWARNIDALRCAGRELWLPDLPGFGDSDLAPEGDGAAAMVEPLAAGLRQLLDGRACDLVGFSFGGLTGGLLAGQHPALLRRLVLVGAPGMGLRQKPAYQLRGWRHLPEPAAQDAVHRHNLAALMLHDASKIDAPTLALHVANVVRDRLPRRRLAAPDALAQALARVRCPVRAIYGAHDVLYHDCIDRLPGAFAATGAPWEGMELIAGAGHWVQYEQPGAFDAALLRALG